MSEGEALAFEKGLEVGKREGGIAELKKLMKEWDKLNSEPNVPLEFDVGHIQQYIEKRLVELKKG